MGLNIIDVALLDAVLSEDKLMLHSVDVPLLSPMHLLLDPDVAKVMDDVHAQLTAAGILLVEKDIATGCWGID